jgi:hypothetical protein
MIRSIVACGLAGWVAEAGAQFTTGGTVSYQLTWRESDQNGGTLARSDGILSPGEHALLRLSVSFTGQNTVATFSPAIGTFSSGTIRGFGAGFLDLQGSNQAQGKWDVDAGHGLGVRPPWDIVGPGLGSGTPAAGGAQLLDLQMGQFPQSSSGINTTNPVQDIWTGIWTPDSYATREVVFQVLPAAASNGASSALILRVAAPTPAEVQSQAGFISVGPLQRGVQLRADPGGRAPALLRQLRREHQVPGPDGPGFLVFPQRLRGGEQLRQLRWEHDAAGVDGGRFCLLFESVRGGMPVNWGGCSPEVRA